MKTVEREFCKNRSCHLFPWCFFSTQFSPFFTGNIFVYGFRTAKRTRDETRKYFSFAIDVRTRRTEVEGRRSTSSLLQRGRIALAYERSGKRNVKWLMEQHDRRGETKKEKKID